MNIRAVSLYCVLVISLAACTIGGNITKSYVANNPGGDELEVRLTGKRYVRGEFMSLGDRSVTVLVKMANRPLSENTPQSISFPALAEISFDKVRSIELVNSKEMLVEEGTLVSSTKREELKLFSRYPQGISVALMDQLLAAYQQDSLIVID